VRPLEALRAKACARATAKADYFSKSNDAEGPGELHHGQLAAHALLCIVAAGRDASAHAQDVTVKRRHGEIDLLDRDTPAIERDISKRSASKGRDRGIARPPCDSAPGAEPGCRWRGWNLGRRFQRAGEELPDHHGDGPGLEPARPSFDLRPVSSEVTRLNGTSRARSSRNGQGLGIDLRGRQDAAKTTVCPSTTSTSSPPFNQMAIALPTRRSTRPSHSAVRSQFLDHGFAGAKGPTTYSSHGRDHARRQINHPHWRSPNRDLLRNYSPLLHRRSRLCKTSTADRTGPELIQRLIRTGTRDPRGLLYKIIPGRARIPTAASCRQNARSLQAWLSDIDAAWDRAPARDSC